MSKLDRPASGSLAKSSANCVSLSRAFSIWWLQGSLGKNGRTVHWPLDHWTVDAWMSI